MDRERVMARVEQLLKEKHMSMNALMKETEISTTMYQWKKNASRDATRSPSLKSIEKICQFFGISLSYFFAENESEENSLTRPRANLPDFSKRLLFLKERHEIKIYMLKRTGRLGAASSFYNWTKRGSLPDVYNLLALSDVFRCTPDFLLGRED